VTEEEHPRQWRWDGQSTLVTAAEFRDVIGRFATGVTVVTTAVAGRWYGTTASAVTSLSLEPPMLLICLNAASATGTAIVRSARFAVNILAEGQGDLARRFATKAPDKFGGVQLTTGRHGIPLLDDALAHVECRVNEQVSGGTHTVFFGMAERVSGHAGQPLAYFRGSFGGLRIG
jgi:flavin reductase (DIM6/NTAB) family NADH-FMN oxidoreductase RutF